MGCPRTLLFNHPRLRAAGSACHAENAVAAACAKLETGDRVIAAGIDSPMYWTPSGLREAEAIVRDAMRSRGAPNVGGTVQHPNSLRGAVVVQGPTTAILLRQRFPGMPITEAHPKALVWLVRIATISRQPRDLVPASTPAVIQLLIFIRTRARCCACSVVGAFDGISQGWLGESRGARAQPIVYCRRSGILASTRG